MIREATRALKQGELRQAMAKLREHEQGFPRGVLTEERRALRVLVLCRNGEIAAGRAEREHFLSQHADSPLAERVRNACPGVEK